MYHTHTKEKKLNKTPTYVHFQCVRTCVSYCVRMADDDASVVWYASDTDIDDSVAMPTLSSWTLFSMIVIVVLVSGLIVHASFHERSTGRDLQQQQQQKQQQQHVRVQMRDT
jgi:hypothetical protein